MFYLYLAVYWALLGTAAYLLISINESKDHPWRYRWPNMLAYATLFVSVMLLVYAMVLSIFRVETWATVAELDRFIVTSSVIVLVCMVLGAWRAATHNNRIKITLG